jgi:hypothetical protein
MTQKSDRARPLRASMDARSLPQVIDLLERKGIDHAHWPKDGP